MTFMRTLLTNHPLVNILFTVVLVLGLLSYLQMPREQDPEINFNFVNITTILPGATASDVEQLITSPLEDALRTVRDIDFVLSNSRESISDITIRFRELSERDFDKRIIDLRREIQAKANDELPEDIIDPEVLEITTSNGFPTAIVVVAGQAHGERLRRQAKLVKEELERISGVDRVQAFGFHEPELHVEIDPRALAAENLTAADVADQLRAAYVDVSAGELEAGDEIWMLRVRGKIIDPEELAAFLISPPSQPRVKVPLDRIARVVRSHKPPNQLVSTLGRPAISMAIDKISFTNNIELVDRINEYIDTKNDIIAGSGIELFLSHDQTTATREAIGIMERNAALGMILVLFVCWVFLGIRIAAFVTLGIAFSIAGTFWLLNVMGNTVNVSVLLGIVIVLGMLVDDAVVVVEAMYYRIQRGQMALDAAIGALREVARPVTSAVFTTISAFAPLMLLPGIVGKFMSVVPLVVTTGLLVSLIEAFWILPSHVISTTRGRVPAQEQFGHWRGRWTHKVRVKYTKALGYVFRRPKRFFAIGALAFMLSIGGVMFGAVRVNFFVSDPFNLFYVNVDQPPDSSIEATLERLDVVQRAIRPLVADDELRSITGMAGLKFTEAAILYGDHYGQIQVALNPIGRGDRTTREVLEAVREAALTAGGDAEVSFFVPVGGPPVEKDIKVNVRGDNYVELRAATDALMQFVRTIPKAENVVDDEVPGRLELTLDLDYRAIREAGLSPGHVSRLLRLHVDGEIIAFSRDEGEKVELRVRGPRRQTAEIDAVLDDPILLSDGGTTTFRALSKVSTQQGSGTIKHYNYRRSITIEGDIGADGPDTVAATNMIIDEWARIRSNYPGVDVDFSGAFDDIQESLDAMLLLFLFGIGLIYLILATQFRSYFQPLLILITVPMAFTGVVFGLFVTQQPLSLYTLYGVVALTGIAVNAAIVLIDATNARIASGMRSLHAVMFAARRRVIPILMTSLTTIAGLFSLATGLGGKSSIWGPVAASMVFGLFVATILTLFLVPVLAQNFVKLRDHRLREALLGYVRKFAQ